MGIVYKVVELATVGAEEIEEALNEWTAAGWTFDTMQFGEWNPGMPAPEWARNSGRGSQWLAMANDTVEMIKWFYFFLFILIFFNRREDVHIKVLINWLLVFFFI